jgi:hypothetical protein
MRDRSLLTRRTANRPANHPIEPTIPFPMRTAVVNGGSAAHVAYQGDVPIGEFITSR